MDGGASRTSDPSFSQYSWDAYGIDSGGAGRRRSLEENRFIMEAGKLGMGAIEAQVKAALPAVFPAPQINTEELKKALTAELGEGVRKALKAGQQRIDSKIDEFVASTRAMLDESHSVRNTTPDPLSPSLESLGKWQTDLGKLIVSLNGLANKRKAEIEALHGQTPKRLAVLQTAIDNTEAFLAGSIDALVGRSAPLELKLLAASNTSISLSVYNRKWYKLSGVHLEVTPLEGRPYKESIEVIPGSATTHVAITPNGLPADTPLTVQALIDSDTVSNAVAVTLPRPVAAPAEL